MASGTCAVTNKLTGAVLTAQELAAIDDPIAKLVLTTEGCPLTVGELAAKLRAADTAGCPDKGAGQLASGVSTRLISETAALTGSPSASYRTVTTRDCGGRPGFGLMMSGTASPTGIGDDFVEVIALDKTTGVFDFYEQRAGRWTFFGTSADYVTGGYTCQSGQCTPKLAEKARCAGCHPGGGLNMKELKSPWVFWDVDSLPGAKETIAKSPDVLGVRLGGPDLEGRVGPGNLQWVKKRLALLKPKGTQEVLRSVFCTVDINLETTAFGSETPNVIPSSFFVARPFSGVEMRVDNADYKALLASTGSRLPGGKRDTPFSFIYPVSSLQDEFYRKELLDQNIIDEDFLDDVLAIDFTRPTFSSTRCDLLKFAPSLPPEQMNATAIREGFKSSLGAETGAAAVRLLANLNTARDQFAHQEEVLKFGRACSARPKKEMLADVMRWASHLRRTARSASKVIEFEGTLPQDDQPDTSKGFDPLTCTLE